MELEEEKSRVEEGVSLASRSTVSTLSHGAEWSRANVGEDRMWARFKG